MTIARPQYPPFKHVQPTKENLPFVELGVVDLSKYRDGPEGLAARQALAADLEEAITTQGFFFLEGHGFPHDKLEYLQAVSQAILDLPLDEKAKFPAGAAQSDGDSFDDKTKLGAERGSGFKPRGYWSMQAGVRDQIEHFNYASLAFLCPLPPPFVPPSSLCLTGSSRSSLTTSRRQRNLLHPTLRNEQAYPDLVRRHLPETTEYFSYLHLVVVRKLSSLFDIILELPEGTIWSLFDVTEDKPEVSGGGFGRAMLYHGMSADDEAKTKGDWLRGHSDASSLTFITPQPMASLQFRDYHDGQWKFVGYRPNALVVNLGDRFEFLTGSFAKSTIHRVVGPPADQRGHRRLGL
ncbi:hypothetical protein JCM3775_003908, partial [Rhodotorula graminis]